MGGEGRDPKRQKRRRLRAKADDAIDTLLNALTIAEKRGVLAELGGPGEGQHKRTTEEVDEAKL
jgi:LPS O-antigen subunit length determinant protein (WzzB/FepE family)